MPEACAPDRLREVCLQAEGKLSERGVSGRVERVEVGSGQRLMFRLDEHGHGCWYALDQGRLEPRRPEDDRKVPLGRVLASDAGQRYTVLSYRPGKRVTLLDRTERRPRILKGFRRNRLEPMVRRYEIAGEALAGHGVRAPEMTDVHAELAAIAISFRPGERLHLSFEAMDLFQFAGEGIRELQDHACEEEFGHFTVEDELGVVDKRAGRLRRAGFAMPSGWAELRGRLDDAARVLPELRHCLAHRDLHDKQFVQHNNHLTLLDFDLVQAADSCLDPANFLAHLMLRNLQGLQGASQRSIDVCGRKFLEGLDRCEEPGFWDRLRFYQASTFCRLALVYLTRCQWTSVVPDLVSMGNRCLDDFDRIRGL